MAHKELKPGEQLEEMLFPEKGIDLHFQEEMRTPDTANMGNNVRAYESLTQRNRGGQRAGISKYMHSQVSGDNLIQHITSIVSTSGEALSWAFEGIDFGDAGYLGIDSGPAGLSGVITGPMFGGGGGYQPSFSFQNTRNLVLTITPADPIVPADGTSTIINLVAENGLGAPAGSVIATLHTNPAGRPGDGVQVMTNSLGLAFWNVSDTTVETVDYTATANSPQGLVTSNTATIDYQISAVLTLVGSAPTVPADGTTATLTVTALNAGVPIVGLAVTLNTSPGGKTGDGVVMITDGAGQAVWTVDDTPIPEIVSYTATAGPDTSNTVNIHWAVIGATFRLTVTENLTFQTNFLDFPFLFAAQPAMPSVVLNSVVPGDTFTCDLQMTFDLVTFIATLIYSMSPTVTAGANPQTIMSPGVGSEDGIAAVDAASGAAWTVMAASGLSYGVTGRIVFQSYLY